MNAIMRVILFFALFLIKKRACKDTSAKCASRCASRGYIASNVFKGTREGRVYPDIWKRLPIKIASTERQQQIARLVDAVQAQYQVKAQGEQIRATINTILSEIEALVEATYREPADTDRVVIIDRVTTYGMSQPLF